MATREQLEAVVREQIARCVTNALTSGVPSEGIMRRASEAILKAAEHYAFVAYITIHYKRPLGNKSACGRGFGGVTDPLEVTCAGCKRTNGFRAALEEVA